MVKSPPNIQKNTFNILRNTGIFPDIFRMFCIFQYYPEKHDCIFRNIRLYISVWDSIFQNIKISRKIQRNIQRNLQIFRNILPVFFRIFFKNPVLYCRIFRNIPPENSLKTIGAIIGYIDKKIPEYSQIFSDILEYPVCMFFFLKIILV